MVDLSLLLLYHFQHGTLFETLQYACINQSRKCFGITRVDIIPKPEINLTYRSLLNVMPQAFGWTDLSH
jgi:hypothetical protein